MILQTLIRTGSPADFHRTRTLVRDQKVRSLAAELSLAVTDKYTTKFLAEQNTVAWGSAADNQYWPGRFLSEVTRSILNIIKEPLKDRPRKDNNNIFLKNHEKRSSPY